MASKSAKFVIVLPLVLILGSEAVTTFYGGLPGIIAYGLLLIGLVNLYYFTPEPADRPLFLSYMLIPLMRILSLVLPVTPYAPVFGYAIIGLPLLIAAGLAARTNGLSMLKIRLAWWEWFCQLLFGISGIPLGMIAYILVPSVLQVPGFSIFWIALGSAILTLFSGFTEEIIFRGLIQQALSDRLGIYGLFLSAILYAGMFIGTRSPGAILFFGLIGLLFAIWVRRSGSLWGVILAHSLLNIILWLILPMI